MSRNSTKLVYIAVALYLGLFVYWVMRSHRLRSRSFEHFSSHNVSSDGLSLAIEYLRQRKLQNADPAKVTTLSRSFAHAALERDAVVFRIAPSTPPPLLEQDMPDAHEGEETPDEGNDGTTDGDTEEGSDDVLPRRLLTEPEENWIRRGGRLILAVRQPYGPLDIRRATATGGDVTKVFPVWPGIDQLKPPQRWVLAGTALDEGYTVLALGSEAVASCLPLGEGDVYVLSCPGIFQNRHLSTGDNLALLESLASQNRPVYFDEHAHGLTDAVSSMELLQRAGLGLSVVLLGFFGAALFWRKRSTLGPPDEETAELRSEAVDFVDALSQLYQRALRRDQALARYQEELNHATATRTGLRGEALRQRVDGLTGPLNIPVPDRKKRDLRIADFQRLLGQLNSAYQRLYNDEYRRDPR